MNNSPSTSAILLAGGIGTRMQTSHPKQLLHIGNKPLARHSFDIFLQTPEISEIVVVCAPTYRELFLASSSEKPIIFADPGIRRQDSTYNGLQAASKAHEFLCVHDVARPFIDRDLIVRVLKAAQQHGAAVAGMPIKFTIKECNSEHFVLKTPDRSTIWEIQTPQIIRRDWLMNGFNHAITHNLTVTDDVSLVELIGKEVKLVEGSHTNVKITVPSDLTFANSLHKLLNT
jgi:2-C-methyl-D-erythritol 4-phosphate cytidylyltransferase